MSSSYFSQMTAALEGFILIMIVLHGLGLRDVWGYGHLRIGMVCFSEELVRGRISEAEMTLEDK